MFYSFIFSDTYIYDVRKAIKEEKKRPQIMSWFPEELNVLIKACWDQVSFLLNCMCFMST
jgi:hypothetical protein